MTRLGAWITVGGLLAALPGSAVQAAEYASIAAPTEARPAPIPEAAPAFVWLAGTPVEVIQRRDGWAQVRDKDGGGLFWVPETAISPARTVITRHHDVALRSAPQDDAAIIATLPAETILPLLDARAPGWLEVSVGQRRGFIRKRDAWGW